MCVQNKTILHITNDYTGSKVYKNLINELDNLNVEQIIYTPLRQKDKVGVNKINFKVVNSKIIYSLILNWHLDRFFYPYKIIKILKDIESKVDFNHIKCIHAHTWYSDGGVAYLLSKKYNIPYIVTVRNTDLNLFQKKIIYLRPFGQKILNNAEKIILISASYKKRILNQESLKSIKYKIEEKIQVIPNGVDPFWIQNISTKKIREINGIFNILYIGKFTKGKQVPLLQEAVIRLNKKFPYKIMLHIVGKGGEDEASVLNVVKKHPEIFLYYGQIIDKSELLNILRNCDVFAMPSQHETFGLVYIEAMLQGLPILYTADEGIDGFYNKNIGEKVNEHTLEEIVHKISKIIVNYDQYSIPLKEIKNNHNWIKIAKRYIDNCYNL